MNVSDRKARTRVSKFARQTVDIHLPILLGLMAEGGQSPSEQAKRASSLVQMLKTVDVAPSLNSGGRPVPFEVEQGLDGPELTINGEMLAKVDDGAFASAMADPIGHILGLSAVATGLVLRTTNEQEIQSLATQVGGDPDAQPVSMTQIEQLVRWRIEIFEDRLYGLVDGLGGWLEAPVVPREEFIEIITGLSKRWAEYNDIGDHEYMRTWLEEVDAELGRTDWANSTDALAEMLWDSVAISPQSALRRAARSLRALTNSGDPQNLLEVLADVLGDDTPVPGGLDHWPNYQEVLGAWTDLFSEEDDVLGARRRTQGVPEVTVYEPPGTAMGFSKPKNLPWNQPLLCWTQRECNGLRDLMQGNEKSLARGRTQIRAGRLSQTAMDDFAPPTDARASRVRWVLQVPTKLPEVSGNFSEAVDRAYASLRAGYEAAFSNLDKSKKRQALKLAKGAYGGYLQSTKSIWSRRLSGVKKAPYDKAFQMMLTGLADALELPIFVDVFEQGVDTPAVSSMPTFTLPAVWYGDAESAPIWLPVETIGESLGQLKLRIRNVSVDTDTDRVKWLGDHHVQSRDLQELSAANLLRSVHEGALLLTIHRL